MTDRPLLDVVNDGGHVKVGPLSPLQRVWMPPTLPLPDGYIERAFEPPYSVDNPLPRSKWAETVKTALSKSVPNLTAEEARTLVFVVNSTIPSPIGYSPFPSELLALTQDGESVLYTANKVNPIDELPAGFYVERYTRVHRMITGRLDASRHELRGIEETTYREDGIKSKLRVAKLKEMIDLEMLLTQLENMKNSTTSRKNPLF